MSESTFAGAAVVRGEITIPLWGPLDGDVHLGTEVAVSGSTTLAVGGASFACAVVRGGPYQGRASYRIAGGAGGWRKQLAAKYYKSDAGVRLSGVFGDAARELGEKIAIAADSTVGPFFVRERGPGTRLLRELSSGQWWIDAAGVTQIGPRPASTLRSHFDVIDYKPETGLLELATDTPGDVLPGTSIVIPGGPTIVAGLVRFSIASGKTRIMVREADDFGIVDVFRDPRRTFFGLYEYRVAEQAGDKLSLRASSPALPDLVGLDAWPGISGGKATLQANARALVGFVGGDPGDPFVAFYEPATGGGWLPTALTLDASGTVKVGPSASMVELGSGSEVVLDPTGRPVCYGDLLAPASSVSPWAITPAPGTPVAKVKAIP